MAYEKTAAAAPTGNPWLIGGAAALDTLGSVFGGGEQEQAPGNLHLVNSKQQALYGKMFRRLMGGGGDAGFGSAVKTGKGQMDQFFADRGVSKDSGFYGAGMADMIANAAGKDSQNRIQMMQNLLNTNLQIAKASGGNMIPGSPSAGFDAGSSGRAFENFRKTGYVAHGVGDTGGGYRYGTNGRWS